VPEHLSLLSRRFTRIPKACHAAAQDELTGGLVAGAGLLLLLLCGGCSLLRPDCDPQAQLQPAATGGAACVVIIDDRLLVIRHRPSGKLDLPGGRSKSGESARCTAQRETWEETGIDVHVGEPLGGRRDLFRCSPLQAMTSAGDPPLRWWSAVEASDVLWVDPRTLQDSDWRYGRPALDFSAIR
jgi:8-oxo-dGTP pyrophosphatase MutT (NUDIX family)